MALTTNVTARIIVDNLSEMAALLSYLPEGSSLFCKEDNHKYIIKNGAWVDVTGTGGGAAWGAITGTLSAQTDLQGALDGKAASLGADDNYVTDAEKVKLTNLTGVNSGDQTLPTDATIVTSDVTTNNVSTSKHGWVPKALNTTHQWLRADGTWASHKMLVATLAGDQATGANTTPVTLSGLVFTYEANSVYKINLYALVAPTAATTGCGFQFDLSSVVTRVAIMVYHQLANTGTLSGGHSVADDASVGVSSGMPGTSSYPVHGEGILVTGANTGTAQLRFRSETTAVTTCKAGTVLVVEKIA